MGLAGNREKQRFGLDPRNTNWSNDTSRFGHKQLEKLGWKPGSGLGMNPHLSNTSHIKVSIKDDNLGLGARLKKTERKDEFDNGECAGLDVFQRILGRLNGKEDKIAKELETQRKDNILNGRWGVHFVRGQTLSSTWDPETKQLKSYANKKRSRSESDEEDEESTEDIKEKEPSKKKLKKEKKEKKDKKSKDKKSKHSKKSKDSKKKEKKEKKKKKKEKKEKKHSSKKDKSSSKYSIAASETAGKVPSNLSTRLSVRSKWIRQKRAATMDSKALNEIFMVTNN